MLELLESRDSRAPLRCLSIKEPPALLCLCHLRWNFVFQRPQHLMVRWAKERRVIFFEEPVVEKQDGAAQGGESLVLHTHDNGLIVATPHLPPGLSPQEMAAGQRRLLDRLMAGYRIQDYLVWYYTPMALPFTRHLAPLAVIYDCMNELSAFADAPPELRQHEIELFARADVVLAGGVSLYEAKRGQHDNIHLFPSSVDRGHFVRGRIPHAEPLDQAGIPHPRLGFLGIIDERMDLTLLDGLAKARPDWHLVLLGPVVNIDPARLPRHGNVHYLGIKAYEALPTYLSGWDVALLPFVRNESTRFISPAEIPEYLAAGRSVVSTSIRDVVHPYGACGLVRIADTVPDFVTAVKGALREDPSTLWPRIDAFLAHRSWDLTWKAMKDVIESTLKRTARRVQRRNYV